MIAYAIIMFITAVLFAVIAVVIYQGNTNLIHDYHRTRVKDKAAYGKAFARALGIVAGSIALSGAIALFGEAAMWGAIGALVIGLVIGIVAIIRVQKKYNGGVFG